MGVLDLKVSGADFYQEGAVNRFEYIQIMEYLKRTARLLDNGLKALIKDEVGGTVKDKNGVTAFDLIEQLRSLVEFEIDPLRSNISSLGVVKSYAKAHAYLLNTIEIKKDLKVKLSKQSENYQIILNAYLDSASSNGSNTALAQNTSNSVSQYDGGFLDKFTTLIEEKSGVKYKQLMLDRRLKVLQKISDVDSDLFR
jgi:hypothetical protein